MNRNRSWWSDMPLQGKFTLCIVLAASIPMLFVATMFFGKLYNMIIADTIREGQEISAEVVPQISDSANEIAGIGQEIQTQRFYQDIFTVPITDDTWEDIRASQTAADFEEYLDRLIEETPVTGVQIYMDRNDEDFTANADAFRYMSSEFEVHSEYWHGIFAGTKESSLYCSPSLLVLDEREKFGDCALIFKKSYYYHGAVYTGYLAVYYSSDLFTRILEKEDKLNGTVSYILDMRDTIVATTSEKLQGLYRMRYATVEDKLLASNSFQETEINSEKVYVAVYQIKDQSWFLVSVIPKAPLIRRANIVVYKFLLIAILCVGLAVLVAIRLARSITDRIRAMAIQMETVQYGIPDPMPVPTIHDEVGALTNSYNYMIREMNDLIEKQKETAEGLRIAEFNALQSQINPHFLYNTMDMINWMAVQGKTEEVSEIVQSMARFYKLTLSRRKNYSTIRDELEHGEIYVQLQNKRFNNEIDFVADIPDELTEYRIPRLTFQPILENAILHGIREKEDKSGTIVITAWSEDDDIFILISDDGIGIRPEILEHILDPAKNDHPTRGTNIAVVNIHNRLKLLYGEAYGLSYSSTPGEGTEVTIRIPKHLGDVPYVPKENKKEA